MEENTLNKNLWQAAGEAGLVLGLVSSGYLLVENLMAGHADQATLMMSFLALGLKITKILTCIGLMRFYMMKFAVENPDADKKSIFKMGRLTALHSSVLFSGILLADILYISPDLYEATFQEAVILMKDTFKLDANTIAALEQAKVSPSMLFMNNIVCCFLYGTALAAIFSFTIKVKNRFNEYKQDEQ